MQRNLAISLSRITGMLLIVMCHIIRYYAFIPGSSSLGSVFNCGVYLFLFISGYLYGTKTIDNMKQWYLKRIVTVALPAIIIAIIDIIILEICGTHTSWQSIVIYCLDLEGISFLNYNLGNYLFDEVTNLGPLWFTTIIMICYMLVPILQKIKQRLQKLEDKKYRVYYSLVLLIGVITSILMADFIHLSYIFIFIVGYVNGCRNLLEKVNLKIFGIFSLLLILSQSVRLMLHSYVDGTYIYSTSVFIYSSVFGIWFVILFSFLQKKLPNYFDRLSKSKALMVLDKYSFFVYLVHGLFCTGIWNVYEQFTLPLATILFPLLVITSALTLKIISSSLSKVLLRKIK